MCAVVHCGVEGVAFELGACFERQQQRRVLYAVCASSNAKGPVLRWYMPDCLIFLPREYFNGEWGNVRYLNRLEVLSQEFPQGPSFQ